MNKKEISLKHLAIIMDGNGRWALNKELPRTSGHAEGEHSLSRTIDWAISNKIKWLTVYAFSTENWLRSSDEVDYLMFFRHLLYTKQGTTCSILLLLVTYNVKYCKSHI